MRRLPQTREFAVTRKNMEGQFTFEVWHIVLAVAIVSTMALHGWLEGL